MTHNFLIIIILQKGTILQKRPDRGKLISVGITTVVLPLLTMHMLYDVRCGTIF